MNEKEKYLFDLQGFIVIKNVLSQEQITTLNRAIDEKAQLWEQAAFRNLIGDPVIEPYLIEILQEEYRLDHEYSIIHQKGDSLFGLHGGGTPYDPGQYYVFRNEQMYSGLTVVSYALTDIGEHDGGFCCIPGSHKSNYRTPREYVDYSETGPTVHISQKAGDVLIFTEALTHGTYTWRGSHERRSLLFKYAPSMIAWAPFKMPQEHVDKLTEKQKSIVQPPTSHHYRP